MKIRIKSESKMYNITIISTNHSEKGKCNSDELYKIIESINPELIFEEMHIDLFNIVYNGNFPKLPSDAPLELKCVKKYIQNYNTKHFPVDIYSSPHSSKEEIYMFKTFNKNENYNQLKNEYKSSISREGFNFLNSNKCLEFFERKSSLEKEIIESETYNRKLLDTYKKFNEVIKNRENGMIQNIYNYSKENQYNQAVFLLGAGHRKSIIKKTLQSEKGLEFKLKWKLFNHKQKTYT
ncbi:hypothetical protein [Wenyingzhuangia sp. IMCC45467]